MLNNHSQVVAPPESGFAHWWMSKYLTWGQEDLKSERLLSFIDDVLRSKKIETWLIEKEELADIITLRRPSSYAELVDCVYLSYAKNLNAIKAIVDKNNYYIKHLNDLVKIWDDAKFIHLVRDGRDVACSYYEVNQLETSSPYKPNLPVDIQEIAREWSLNVSHIASFLNELPKNNSITVKYEDLVLESAKTLLQITEFLGIQFEEEMLQYYKSNEVNKMEPHETLAWKMATREKPDKSKIGRYRKDLTKEHSQLFIQISRRELRMFNYDF